LIAVWVLAITPIIWADRGFNISYIPRLRAEYTQEGGRIPGTSA
jgi:hypothetical protein